MEDRMTYDELTKLEEAMLRILGPISTHWSTEAITMRLTLECALSLKWIEENGVSLSNVTTRDNSLCVSVESSNA